MYLLDIEAEPSLLMKTSFFPTLPRVLCTLLACAALIDSLAAATGADKSPAKLSADNTQPTSLAKRVAQASKGPCPWRTVLNPLRNWTPSDEEASHLSTLCATT